MEMLQVVLQVVVGVVLGLGVAWLCFKVGVWER